jgi:hypothetical protein
MRIWLRSTVITESTVDSMDKNGSLREYRGWLRRMVVKGSREDG